MKYALINPNWHFEGSVYFGCREPHLPLEFGYSKALLEAAGHEVRLIDAQMEGMSLDEIRRRIQRFRPDFTVVTTAPSYLFWRCPPPELRVPMEVTAAVRDVGGALVGVGPHASTTPRATLRKLGAHAVVMGECEEILPQLAGDWSEVASICFERAGRAFVQGGVRASDLSALPALGWTRDNLFRHIHHHHRFDAPPTGPGAEMETSRGCPYHCTFCAKDNFRNKYRKRPLRTILEELDALIGQGVRYIYFIDEIFLPNPELLEALALRPVNIGIQTRIDLWNHEMLDLLGRAGCVSIEAGVESVTEKGRAWLDKTSRMTTVEMVDRLVYAKQRVPFVQANLIATEGDEPSSIEAFRGRLIKGGVWANQPVPLFPYPGSPEYTRRWGVTDEIAWERAHGAYLRDYKVFSDIQDQHPLSLVQLEANSVHDRS